MRFWDSSALVPLLWAQPATPLVEALLRSDADIVAWWGTPIEVASAAARMRRGGHITLADETRVLRLLDDLAASWTEVLPSERLRSEAQRLLRIHALRAADSLQLASARIWAPDADSHELVTFDPRLRFAAKLEGFRVVPTDE